MEIETLGDVIRNARMSRGLSLRELARRLQITPSYVSDIEHDRRIPSEEVLEDISRELLLDSDDLMAMAGRIGFDAERYLRRHPTAGVLFRRLSEWNVDERDLKRLLRRAERISTQHKAGRQ